MENGGLTPDIQPVSRRGKTFGNKPRGIIETLRATADATARANARRADSKKAGHSNGGGGRERVGG